MKYYIPNLLLGQQYYRYLVNHIDYSIIKLICKENYIKTTFRVFYGMIPQDLSFIPFSTHLQEY